jgi:hypothetical protein
LKCVRALATVPPLGRPMALYVAPFWIAVTEGASSFFSSWAVHGFSHQHYPFHPPPHRRLYLSRPRASLPSALAMPWSYHCKRRFLATQSHPNLVRSSTHAFIDIGCGWFIFDEEIWQYILMSSNKSLDHSVNSVPHVTVSSGATYAATTFGETPKWMPSLLNAIAQKQNVLMWVLDETI